jgi:hypothetical protein
MIASKEKAMCRSSNKNSFSCDTHGDGPLRHEMTLDKELYRNKGLHHPPKHISSQVFVKWTYDLSKLTIRPPK